MSLKRPSISVVIPTLNEAQNLPLVLPHIPQPWVDEVILVDGRSSDRTCEVARELLPEMKIVLETRPGKGAAMRAGFAAARGDIIITLDADGSHDPREIPRLVRALLEGSDFVKGSRFAAGGGTTDMPPYRKWGNRGLGYLVNWLFNGEITDLCYGYHAFWRYCLDVIPLDDAPGFEIDTVIYVRALRQRLRLTEVPSFEGYRFFGFGKLQTLPDGWRVLRTILREWSAHLRGTSPETYLGFRGVPPLGRPGPEPERSGFLAAMRELLARQAHPHVRWNLALHLMMNHLNAASGSLIWSEPQGDGSTGLLAYAGQVQLQSARQLLDVFENGLAGWVAQYRQPALIANTQSDTRWLPRPWDREQGSTRSAISAPLLHHDRVLGVVTLVRAGTQPFTLEEVVQLTLTANALGAQLGAEARPRTSPLPAWATAASANHSLAS